MKKLLLTYIMLTAFIFNISAQVAPIDIYLGSTKELNYSWASNATVTEVTTGIPYEGTEHFNIAYNVTGWYAGGGFNVNDWGFGVKQDYSSHTHLVIAWKHSGGVANTLIISLGDSTQPNSVSGTDVTLSNSGTYQIDSIPLSTLKGATALDLSNIVFLNWHLGTVEETSTGDFYIDHIRVVHVATTDVVQSLASSVTVSPNPSSDVYHINGLKPQHSYTVSDAYGNVVKQGTGTDELIDLSISPEGLYFLMIMEGEKIATKKLIKDK